MKDGLWHTGLKKARIPIHSHLPSSHLGHRPPKLVEVGLASCRRVLEPKECGGLANHPYFQMVQMHFPGNKRPFSFEKRSFFSAKRPLDAG